MPFLLLVLSTLLHARIVLHLFFPLLWLFYFKYLSSYSFLTGCNLFTLSCCDWFLVPVFPASMYRYLSRFSSTYCLCSAERCHQQTSWRIEITAWPHLAVCPSLQQTRTGWGQNQSLPLTFDPSVTPTLYHTYPAPIDRGWDLCQGKKMIYKHLEDMTLSQWVKHSNFMVHYIIKAK